MPTPLATFTPSLIAPETLEKLFVARESVLDDLVARASKAMLGRTRAHRLLIGPRGAGKTHLLSLANHRISQLDPSPPIAWLPEDPWMIDGYADLLREICKAVSSTAPLSPGSRQRMSPDDLERELRTLTEEGGPIIVLAENFDRILSTIDVPGQRRLRRFMENDRTLLLLVSATRLTAGLLQQDGPFYGFFSTYELAPLTVEQATEMLARIADHRGDEALATRLHAPASTDRYRLAAIDALAGGQPRVWALLASALTVDGLGALADVLLTRFDDLTPYYQEQLGRLAPRERKVVRTLADLDRAVNVKEIAEALAVDQKSLAKTVSTLRSEGWLAEVPVPLGAGDARKTYFELAEPLARLAFQLKDNRGEAIPMLVAFLSTWFSREQLGSPLEHLSEFVHRHLDAAAGVDGLHDMAEAFGTMSRAGAFFLFDSASRRESLPDAPLLAFSEALASLASGNPAPYLELPSAQRRALRSAVEEHGAEGAQRLCIELGSKGASWIPLAERLATSGKETLLNRRSLAAFYFHTDRIDEATALMDDVVRESRDKIGPHDRVTLDARLARLEMEPGGQGDPELVAKLETLLADSVRALGQDHPTTTAIRDTVMFEVALIDLPQALVYLDEKVSDMNLLDKWAKQVSVLFRLSLIVMNMNHEKEKSAQEGKEAELTKAFDRVLAESLHMEDDDGEMTLLVRSIMAERVSRSPMST